MNRTVTRKVRLLRGREELITFKYGKTSDNRSIEHVTMEVPNGFLEPQARGSAQMKKPGKR